MKVKQLELWHDDSPDRPWRITREEIWILDDAKGKTSRSLHFRDFDDARRGVVNVLKYRDRENCNLYWDNADDFCLTRACAIEFGNGVFNFIPDGATAISYADVKKELENVKAS